MDARFLAFVAVSALLIATPGPDMALVARNAFGSGAPAARATALGVAAGIAVWGIAAGLGIAALLARSQPVFFALKLAGALYLLYLGWQALRAAGSPPAGLPTRPHPLSPATAFRQGLVGNVLNPKAAAIFVTVIPQFILPGDSPLRLGLMLASFEAMLLLWLALYGSLVARLGRSRAGERARRVLHGITGAVLVGFALRLAVERR